MALTHEDVAAILKIIDESPYDEVRLEIGDLKLHVRRHGPIGPADPSSGMQESQAGAALSAGLQADVSTRPGEPARPVSSDGGPAAGGLVAVRAPMLGTFYRASAPGEAPFVKVGDKVEAGDTVCLVEVMKLFNSVQAGVAGTVAKIEAENGAMVEHGQVLILIESDAPATAAAIQ